MNWLDDNRISVDPPKNPKKITGTRFGAILGKNKWKTPFGAWCEITRTYEEPFTDTKYTLAGKAIEPKQIQYMADAYFMDIATPTDVFGTDYFKKTHGDFFPDEPITGGMYDAIAYDEHGRVSAVLEMKTSKRSEDWVNDIPEYYALQAALYAYLLNVDKVIMVASFLQESDYDHPEEFVPSAENTIVRPFSLRERYPTFETMLSEAERFWNEHVLTGISPEYDESADADILDVLRTNTLNPDTDIEAVLAEIDDLQGYLDDVSAKLADKNARLTLLKGILKDYAKAQFRPGDEKIAIGGGRYKWTLAKTHKTEADIKALDRDGLLDKYTKTTETYRLIFKKED